MEIKVPYQPGVCPHCDSKIGNNRTDVYRYGSPVRTCPKCKEQYLNRCYHEIELEGFNEKDVSLEANKKNVRNAVILLVAAIAVNVLFYLLERHTWLYLLFVGLGLIYLAVAVTDIIKVKSGKRQQELQKEQQASKERLSDPEYAKVLKELGYEVPEAYLPEETEE